MASDQRLNPLPRTAIPPSLSLARTLPPWTRSVTILSRLLPKDGDSSLLLCWYLLAHFPRFDASSLVSHVSHVLIFSHLFIFLIYLCNSSAASRTVQSTIVDPTIQTLSDPALQNNLRTSFGTVASSAQKFGSQANGFVKERSGVDFVGKFGELGLTGGSGTSRGGYSQAARGEDEDDDQQGPNYGGGYSDKGWGGDFGKKKGGGEEGEGDDFLAVSLHFL